MEGVLSSIINNLSFGNLTKDDNSDALMKEIKKLNGQNVNIMLVGATGVGKSTTINTIFNSEVATVGYGTDPETSFLKKYSLGNLILWDTPGLGDNPDKDKEYASKIAELLKRRDESGNFLIDEVVVVLDGSSRDMKTAYEIIEGIVIPFLGDTSRMVIAINQCDMGMKGRYWNYDLCKPEPQLIEFMEKKVLSVSDRIRENMSVETRPVYYSALYKYNISKLLLLMLKSIPETKRYLAVDYLNRNPEIWKKNDDIEDYNLEIKEEVKGSLLTALSGAAKGAVAGATVGNLIPVIGPVIGAAVGAALGFLGGLIEG